MLEWRWYSRCHWVTKEIMNKLIDVEKAKQDLERLKMQLSSRYRHRFNAQVSQRKIALAEQNIVAETLEADKTLEIWVEMWKRMFQQHSISKRYRTQLAKAKVDHNKHWNTRLKAIFSLSDMWDIIFNT